MPHQIHGWINASHRLSGALSLLTLGLVFLPGVASAQSARFDEFAETSPKAGEMAPPFTLLTLENEPFDLLEVVADRPVVIEFGSFT